MSRKPAGDAYRQMMLNATPASLFLSSVRLHFLDDQVAYQYFQEDQIRYSRKELDVMSFVHRNAVLLQRDVDLLKQLFTFLTPYSCTVAPQPGGLALTLSGPGMNPVALSSALPTNPYQQPTPAHSSRRAKLDSDSSTPSLDAPLIKNNCAPAGWCAPVPDLHHYPTPSQQNFDSLIA
ncbi:hypothetical protein BKA62DRAFT_768349 [Auriculariales sp. MPI-PUGE-AT-0066]|nr:hypothetical protein BKA62DRAFT_768349 [Auriculariales sp. MPI-PUGE-AT-0066]